MPKTEFKEGLTFADVLLEPRFSQVERSEVDLHAQLTKKIKLNIPLISAAMDTVTEAPMAFCLGKLGGLGVLHRNCTIAQQVTMVKKVKKAKLLCGAACGPTDIERAKTLDKAGCDVIFLDCAHAHLAKIIKASRQIKKITKAQLVVGNIATSEAARAYISIADALKVGIGPGSICTTRVVTGVGVPQLTAIMDVVKVASPKKIPVIADGGLQYSGDIIKALAAGADTVMLGSLLAGTAEAPGKIIKIKGQSYKALRGMGSLGAMTQKHSSDRYFQSGAKQYVPEGVEGLIPFKGSLKEVVAQHLGGLKSGMGYLGAAKTTDLRKQARFIKISPAGIAESHPHTISNIKKAPNY